MWRGGREKSHLETLWRGKKEKEKGKNLAFFRAKENKEKWEAPQSHPCHPESIQRNQFATLTEEGALEL